MIKTNRAGAVTPAESEEDMYYLTTRTRRKNARKARSIVTKGNDFEHLCDLAENNINKRYIVEIYNGRWELVKRF